MSNFLSDQDIVDLIGDIANFIGTPGGIVNQIAQPGSAQHALQPFTATLALSGMTQQVITVGGPGQRCILPTVGGGSNIVANAQQTLAIPMLNSSPVYPRYDLIVGQALHNSGPSGQASLGAQFSYSVGTAGGGPPGYTPDFAPVVQVTARPNNATVAASDVQVVLPGVSFASLAVSGGLHTLPGSGVSVPLTAAVARVSFLLERTDGVLDGALVGWGARSNRIGHHAVVRAEPGKVALIRSHSHLPTQNGGEQVIFTESLGDAAAGDQSRLNAAEQRWYRLVEHDHLVTPA